MNANLMVHELVVIVLGGAVATVVQRTPLQDAWKQAALAGVGLATLIACVRTAGLM